MIYQLIASDFSPGKEKSQIMTAVAHIFDIQGLSVHDGPGNRTLVFFQGCTLNCDWCSNPEGISQTPILLYDTEKCRLDGNCVKDCSFGAIEIKNEQLIISRSFCKDCSDYACLNNCYTKALSISSKKISVSELMRIIQRDRSFWGQDGGITLSGGEPLLQIDFVEEFLKQSYESYIHTAIETCGNVPWQNFERIMPFLDWIFFDLKHPDTLSHENTTGVGNELILENVKRLSKEFEGRLIIRIPVIPGFNNSDEIIEDYIDFFKDNNIQEINLLPLHHLGKEKYSKLGRDYSMDINISPAIKEMKQMAITFTNAGFNCYIDSNTPF